MRAVGIRELKNRLSEYLRMVSAGEEILVTDRGEVVAELRRPERVLLETPFPKLLLHVQEGKARLGLQNRPDLYPALRPLRSPGVAQKLLAQERGER